MSGYRRYFDPNKLTPAENRIIALLVSGKTTRATIAEAMGTSERTVSAQLSTIYGKIGRDSTLADLLYWALHNGWAVDVPRRKPEYDLIYALQAKVRSLTIELQLVSDELKQLSQPETEQKQLDNV